MIDDTAPFRVADLDVLPYGHRCELLDGVLVIGEGLTRETLTYLRRDRRRYELIDSVVVVSPAPGAAEQRATAALAAALGGSGRVVTPAPYVVLAAATETQPDLLATDADGRRLLVAEVSSPYTGAFDRTTKRDVYERAGVPAYWVVDPRVPSLTVSSLNGGRYADVVVAGEEAYEATVPFPVRVVPAALV